MDTEGLATTAVIERVSFCKGLSPFINDGDKEPSWDGNIYVYPNSVVRKSELIAKVPVQVKGERENKKVSTAYSFRADVADLRNYANDGGVIYFVVAINEKNRSKHIFYKCLLPFDLQKILEAAGTNETKSIKLKMLPDDDNAIRQIFLSFIADKKRQAAQIVWSEEQALAAVRQGASFKFHIQPKDVIKSHREIMRESTTQPFYLYVQTKEGIEFPFAKMEDDAIKISKQKIDIPVFVDKSKFYNHFYHGFENGKKYIYIGETLNMPVVEDGKRPQINTITYKLSGMLSNRIVDSDFLLALSQHKKIRIGHFESHHINMNNEEEVSRLNIINTEYKLIKSALDYFGVKDDLNMDILTDADYRELDYLIRAVECEEMYFKENDLPNLFYTNKKIGNIRVRLLARKDGNNEGYKLFNAFIDEADDFLCSNINYNVILNSIRTMKSEDIQAIINFAENQYLSANNMLLEIIKAYDSQPVKNNELLQFSIDMVNVLLSKDPVSIINKMQMVKRQRPFSNDEISSLVTLRNKKSQRKIIKCAVAILLDETEDAKKLLNELPKEERKTIVDYPLYSFINNVSRK